MVLVLCTRCKGQSASSPKDSET